MATVARNGNGTHDGGSASGRQSVSHAPGSVASADSCGDACVSCLPFGASEQRPKRSFDAYASQGVPVPSMTDGDILQATDLIKLSLEERTTAEEDVHGVARHSNVDDPNFIRESLRALDAKISKIRDKKAFDIASFYFPRYTKNPAFRLVFLRALRFDVEFAARRIVLFFDKKLELLGKRMLGRRVALRDLDQDVVDAFKIGCFQLFPRQVRDQSGRPVYFHISSAYGTTNRINLLRAFLYSILSGTQEMSPYDHLRGVVIVIHFVGVKDNIKDFLSFLMQGLRVVRALPMGPAAMHICCDNPNLKNAVSLVQLSVSTKARVRIRVHFGSYMETLYALQAFGISSSSFPMKNESEIDQERFREYLRIRIQREDAEWEPTELSPQEYDILLGRGRPFQSHSGNVFFGNFVREYRGRYTAARGKNDKAAIVDEILSVVSEKYGGRFLKMAEDGSQWLVASDDEAKRKVRHVLRPKP